MVNQTQAAGMKIGAEFRSGQWPALRQRLQANEPGAWREAVGLLHHRLGDRYLSHAGQLLGRQHSGFAVLAVDCAVIEAFEQFRRGVPRTPWKQSGAFFKAFLTTTRFKAFFTTKMAKLFYDTLRCGILHQAEAEADSLVKRKRAAFVVQLSPSGAGLVINARRFHEELEAAFNDYKEALLRGDTGLRSHFIKKMNHIARILQGGGGVV